MFATPDASVTFATPPQKGISDDSAAQTRTANAETAARVRDEFLFAWNAYKQYAWGHDELKPLSKSYKDWYGVSLYMTPVDALDTMILMGLKTQADEDRELIATKLSFDQDISVKNFEITIRLLGGLLSSYQLTGDKRLLALALDLGNRLLPAFNSPTGMPYVFVNLKTGAVRDPNTNPAEVGTLLIEFGTLSKLTRNPVYYDKAKRAMVELYNRRSKIGLVGSEINIETGAWINPSSDVSGGIDSYYEYLLKCWLLFGDKDCKRMWDASLKALNTYVADETATGLWYGTVDMNTGKRLATHWGALDAFFAGTLALGGDRSRAQELEDSSFRMWNIAGIEPEEIDYSNLTITAPGYPLRPEIIESAYYLHQFTKNPRIPRYGAYFSRCTGEILQDRRGLCGAAERPDEGKRRRHGELLFGRNAEISLPDLCAAHHSGFEDHGLQHRSASDSSGLVSSPEPRLSRRSLDLRGFSLRAHWCCRIAARNSPHKDRRSKDLCYNVLPWRSK